MPCAEGLPSLSPLSLLACFLFSFADSSFSLSRADGAVRNDSVAQTTKTNSKRRPKHHHLHHQCQQVEQDRVQRRLLARQRSLSMLLPSLPQVWLFVFSLSLSLSYTQCIICAFEQSVHEFVSSQHEKKICRRDLTDMSAFSRCLAQALRSMPTKHPRRSARRRSNQSLNPNLSLSQSQNRNQLSNPSPSCPCRNRQRRQSNRKKWWQRLRSQL